MPQHTQNSLVHILLFWITILSVVQVMFICFFFTAGLHGPSQNSSAVAPQRTKQIQPYSTPSPPTDFFGKGKMLTFQHSAGRWKSRTPELEIVSEEKDGKVLRVKKDGYFFLTLQVTMKPCTRHNVSLKGAEKVFLQGLIINNTCSTGLLGKVEDLSAGETLEVTIDGQTDEETIVEDRLQTHLDIIYLFKPSH